MTFIEIILVASALAVDAFTVGSVVGMTCNRPRQLFRLSWHFGVFQALMPLLGAATGSLLIKYVKEWDHWVVLIILSALGAKMIRSAFQGEDKIRRETDLTKGLSLVSLSLAVSIDAFAVGVSLPAAEAPIALAVTIIGITAAVLTLAGMSIAGKVKHLAGRKAEAAAGLVLIGLGVKILLEHLGIKLL